MPASSETIATSLLESRFNNDDFPALTSPIIETLNPSLIFSPTLLSSIILVISEWISFIDLWASLSTFSGKSSSEKSIFASIKARDFIIFYWS